jgi:hypothetical protein
MDANLSRAALVALALAAPVPVAAQSAFTPFGSTPDVGTATTTTSTTALTLPSPPPRRIQLRIYNTCATAPFIAWGTSGITATTARMPLGPGAIELFTVPEGTTHVAQITSSGTCSIYYSPGQGE